ncbi:MAG TPA: signal peptidase II [Clostridiales bacterium]|nr:signal peptidase II [Clostridiales bacterium]
MKQHKRHLIYFLILVSLDLLTKLWAKTTLRSNGPYDIIPSVLKLQYHENSGAVWGILQGKASLLSVFTLIILAALVYVYFQIPKEDKFNLLKLIFVAIGAGAVGNMIDRFSYGYVIDFIYFELINFPIFNVADSYITVSSILIIILGIFYYKEEDLAFLDNMFKKRNKEDK